MQKLLLIDAHALIHRMYHAMAPLTTEQGEPIGALYGLSGHLLKVMTETVRPDFVAACFDRPEPTFRKESYKEYKAHRTPAADDLVSQLIKSREVFEKFKIKMFELPGFEADDLIGTLACRLKGESDLQIIISSGDRDLLQLVENDTVVVDLLKNGGEAVRFNEQAVKEKYGLHPTQIPDLKGLTGDVSDNIPGVSGIGEKSATPLLKEFETVEGVYENLVIINPKIAKKLEGKQDIALMSKKLATLECNAPLFLDSLQDVRAIPLDVPLLTEYFSRLGFVSLIRRLEQRM